MVTWLKKFGKKNCNKN